VFPSLRHTHAAAMGLRCLVVVLSSEELAACMAHGSASPSLAAVVAGAVLSASTCSSDLGPRCPLLSGGEQLSEARLPPRVGERPDLFGLDVVEQLAPLSHSVIQMPGNLIPHALLKAVMAAIKISKHEKPTTG
jgi:hypothetical protein